MQIYHAFLHYDLIWQGDTDPLRADHAGNFCGL